MQINENNINFIYNSMNRDIKQSNLRFWKNIACKKENLKEYNDIFVKIREKASKENNLDIIKFIKEAFEQQQG